MPKLISLKFHESGSYADQFNRPYALDMSGDRLKPFINATQNGEKFTSSAMRQFGNEAIGVSPLMGAPLAIDNGWSDRRCIFLMAVEADSVTVNSAFPPDRIYFVGWTDHPGIIIQNQKGLVDENMHLYFNSFVRVRASSRHPLTGAIIWRVVDNIQLLSGSFNPSFANPAAPMHSTAVSMRPQDVFSQMGLQFAKGYTINGTTQFTNGLKPNSRLHDMPDHYLSKIFTKLSDAVTTYKAGNTDYLGGEGVFDMAVEKSSDTSLYQRPVFQELDDNFSFCRRGFVLFRELAEIFPGILNPNDPRVESVMMDSDQRLASNFGRGSQYAGMMGSDIETVKAVNLASSVPALMSSYGVAMLEFTATNQQIGGGFNIRFPNDDNSIRSFADGLDVSQIGAALCTELDNAILRPMDIYHNYTIDLAMQCNLFSHSHIRISINNGPVADFVLPTFADGLTSPCFDATGVMLNKMAEGVDVLRDHLVQSNLQYADPEDLEVVRRLQMQAPINVAPAMQNGGINLFGNTPLSGPMAPAPGTKKIKLF